MMKRSVLAGLLTASVAASAGAYEVRVRFQWRPESGGVFQDALLVAGQQVVPVSSAANPNRIRIQVGVFDDALGPAPAGGFFGFNTTTITTNDRGQLALPSGTGRISPFTFAFQTGANGVVMDSGRTIGGPIDAAHGPQTIVWPLGQPRPPAVVSGRNEYASIYQFVDWSPVFFEPEHLITVNVGQLFIGQRWFVVTESPPDPEEGTNGQVVYGPDALLPGPPATWRLRVSHDIPAPATAALLGIAVLAGTRRRRNEETDHAA